MRPGLMDQDQGGQGLYLHQTTYCKAHLIWAMDSFRVGSTRTSAVAHPLLHTPMDEKAPNTHLLDE